MTRSLGSLTHRQEVALTANCLADNDCLEQRLQVNKDPPPRLPNSTDRKNGGKVSFIDTACVADAEGGRIALV